MASPDATERLRITVVVPCFDEALRLDTPAILAFARAHPEIRLLFVDDGSGDATREVLRELVSQRPRQLDLLGLDRNVGKAEAVRRGVLQVLDDGHATAVGYWDADLATPLHLIPTFAQRLQAAPRLHILLGARVKMLGYTVRRHVLRHYAGRVMATAATTLLGMPVYDTQAGAKLIRVGEGTRALFAQPFSSRWAFDVELLARWLAANPDIAARDAGVHLEEMPLRTWVDVPGSKVRLKDFVKGPVDLARIAWRYRRVLVGRRLPWRRPASGETPDPLRRS